MTSIRRALAASATVCLLALAACSTSPATQDDMTAKAVSSACTGDEGVTVVVDGSALPDDPSATWCVFTDGEIGAADALTTAGITTEGTEEYGDQVVCRVDGAPAADTVLEAEDGSEYTETCASMPAAFAYWSLWVQPAAGEWAYAEEGLSTLRLQPGESVELLFTLNGEPASPTS